MSKKHSNIGASSCYRWWNCPGSVELCSSLPEAVPSKYAMEGTAAHEMAETCMNQRVNIKSLIGQRASNGVVFTSEMAKYVSAYLTVVLDDASKVKVNPNDIFFETHFHLDQIDEDAYGTCDAHFGQPFGKLYVYDLKYGAGVPVSAEGNLQMQYYALGAMEGNDYKEIEMVIVQPRTYEPIKRWVVSAADMDEFAKALAEHIKMAKCEGSELCDGKWCKWCPALASCPQVAKNVVTVAQQDFATHKPLPEPGALTPITLKLVLDKAELLTDWVAAVEAYALTLMEAGTKIPGWKLVPKRAHRKWKDEFAVETELAELGDAIYDKKLKTPKQMENVAGKEKVAELSETPNNGNTLAPDTDGREEAAVDFTVIEAAVDFTDLTVKTTTTETKKKGRPHGSKNKKDSDADF